VELRNRRTQLVRELRNVRRLEHTRRDDHAVGSDARAAGVSDEPTVFLRQRLDPGSEPYRQLEAGRVCLEIVRHLVLGRIRGPAGRERHPRQPVAARRRVELQRVPARAPAVADPFVPVDDQDLSAPALQVVPEREPGLARSDD
jgi:hypothetical protein